MTVTACFNIVATLRCYRYRHTSVTTLAEDIETAKQLGQSRHAHVY